MSTVIALVLAFTAAYKGGVYDDMLRTATDTVLVIPTWPILVVLSAYVTLDLCSMSLLLAAFSWPGATRMIRAQVLSLKERPYIELAKISGLRDFEIIFKEMLPNFLPYIAVGLAGAMVGSILAETGLRMIGLGPARIVSLGALVNWAMLWGVISTREYHILVAPILALILIFMSVNLINVGLDDVFNPRLKKITGL